MAVGRAPFHAAKREDIYRKLKAREYSWPDISKFPNEITDDLHDIVSLLLVHEDDRPTPDQIVNHPFFRLGHVPLKLDNTCTSRVPKWPKIRPPTAATIKRGYTEDWFTLCKASAVGEYEPGKTFGAYGSRRNKTFAKDTVYLPFPERTHWPFQAAGALSEIPEEKESSSEGQALVNTSGNDRQRGRLSRLTKKDDAMPTLKENREPVQDAEIPRRVVDKQPTRMRAVRKISNPGRVTAATAAPVPLRVPKDTRLPVQRTRSTRETAKDREIPMPETEPLGVAKTNSRVSEKSEPQIVLQATAAKQVSAAKVISSEIPLTDPATVLARLHTFRDNIARALQRKKSTSRHIEPPQLPYVSKWVDYSRKHGVGYVLEDNTVGCVAVATKHHPTTVAFTQDGHAHLSRLQKNPGQSSQVPLEYYAHAKADKGLVRVDLVDEQRREGIQSIWQKFGRYMCAQLGVDVDERPRKRAPYTPNFVKFYQRLGNVGIWGFVDGSFQANFPDHTKLVLSPDAGYCNFICLSLDALDWLQANEKGQIPWKYIKDREVLHGSLQQLLYGSADKADTYKEITEENNLRPKLEFLQSILDGWIEGGGIGCLMEPRKYVWQGDQLEGSKKQDWVSVGRFGGDVL